MLDVQHSVELPISGLDNSQVVSFEGRNHQFLLLIDAESFLLQPSGEILAPVEAEIQRCLSCPVIRTRLCTSLPQLVQDPRALDLYERSYPG